MNDQVKTKITALLKDGGRFDGRKAEEYRKPLLVEKGVSITAEGSARVTIGETVVLAGVKMELGKPYPDQPDQGSMMVGVELLPMSNPDFEPGPPSAQAIELARVVDRGIRESNALDFKALCIKPGELAWIVIIDIVTVNDAGNLFDASALAALAALQDAKMPSRDGEIIKYKETTDDPLPIKDLPVSVTIAKLGDNLVVDLVTEEEKVIDARLTTAFLSDGTLCAMQKGGGALSSETIMAMIDLAGEKSKELRAALDAAKQGALDG